MRPHHRATTQLLNPANSRRLAVLLPFAIVFCAFAPALGGTFVTDDWAILTLARHGAPAWTYYFTDHAATYSYRPNGMLVWHALTQLFGDAALPQYIAQFTLHAMNASLVTLLLLRLGASPLRAFLFGLVFGLHPISFGTSLWLSDRYDLIALNGALALLLAIDAWRRGARGALLLMALSACWAAGAKETALVVAPAAGLWIWMARQDRQPAALLLAWVAALLPFALALFARWWIFGTSGVDRVGTELSLLQSMTFGVLHWARTLPMALLGFQPGVIVNVIAGGLLLASLGTAVAFAMRSSTPGNDRRALVAGVMLLLLPALVQSPVTSFMLAAEEPLALQSNFRFFYMALAGLLIFLVPLRVNDRPGHYAFRFAGGVVIVLFAVSGWQTARQWAFDSTRNSKLQLVTAIGEGLKSTDYDTGCVLYIDGIPEQAASLYSYVDSVAKSQLPPGDPRVGCIVLGSRSQALAITGTAPEMLPAGIQPRPLNGVPAEVAGKKLESRAIMNGHLHVHFPDVIAADAARELPQVRLLRWNGKTLVDIER